MSKGKEVGGFSLVETMANKYLFLSARKLLVPGGVIRVKVRNLKY